MKLPWVPPQRDTSAQMLPLINLVFLLLVFFLLAGSLRQPELFAVDPPLARATEHDGREAALLVAADGALAWAGTALSPSDLSSLAERWRSDHGGAPLPVRADARAEALKVMAVLEQLRAAGVDDARLIVRQPAEAP